MSTAAWRIFVDVGGTFTDAIGIDASGHTHRIKVLSNGALRGTIVRRVAPARYAVREDWGAHPDLVRGFGFRMVGGASPGCRVERYDADAGVLHLSESFSPPLPEGAAFEVQSPDETPVLAAHLITGTPRDSPLPAISLRLATTLGTNALLQRAGVPTALFTTLGFGDLLRIGTQQRPDLFALDIRLPEPLPAAVVEVDERLAADGTVLRPLDTEALSAAAADLVARGIRVAAVALMHAYLNPRHEEQIRDLLRREGFTHVSCSADLAASIKLLPRTQTAVVDAYLGPVVQDYLDRVRSRLPGGSMHVMTSAGGLVSPAAFHPKDSLLSGPAGGVVGAAQVAARSGIERVIAFDMGGTSTDVARYDGDYEYLFEHQVGDARLVAPALAIESVAAGGGSICWFDGDRLRVGPQSAGAAPGPACYGAGGPLTLTDVNLLLGRLDPARFEVPLLVAAADRAAADLEASIASRSAPRPGRETLLEGFLEIANERMADAIRSISVRRGYDPSDYALVAFGGAGAQHACGVADRLGITTVMVPPDAGLLSALGLRDAVLERFASEQVLAPLDEVEAGLSARLDRLAGRAVAQVVAEGVAADQVHVRRRIAHLRLTGQDGVLEVPCDRDVPLRARFIALYEALYGHSPENRDIEVESLRVVASTLPQRPAASRPPAASQKAAADGSCRARFDQAWHEVALFERDRLSRGARLQGPGIVRERHSATVIECGWDAELDEAGAILLRRATRAGIVEGEADRPEEVRLELFTNRFRAIATEMGERLRRTAISTNIKERLDFSCALLDARGELVVNAPHIPVHLGAIGLCVRSLLEALPLRPGDVAATNHPAYGGSHLPDITVVTPVYVGDSDSAATPLGFVASRAHHAELGGERPGSMPFSATSLAAEAVVIPPLHLVRGGTPCWEEMRRLLTGALHPTRALEDNLADLRAAAAANHAGAEALRALAAEHGRETVQHYMGALTGLAERRMREALRHLPAGTHRAEERLDDGTLLRVAIEIADGAARIDFNGTAGVHAGNLNATPAIVASAVIYVLRLLLRAPLPLNEGLMRPVTLDIPPGLLRPDFGTDPASAPAVTGGNVETSQRLVDTLLKALRVAACSQGTMNNIIFGTDRFGYYETLGGGCGAGPDFHGASAVHSHMTNTRITDPEIIEHRYPVRVERFAIRAGSGGAGRYRGGDGVIREFTFLQPMSLSILSQHRTVPPFGLEGGAAGAPGRQRVIRANGESLPLGSIDGCEVGAGDRLLVETPGGGGYGRS